ncbi:MAG: VOC family protein [Acidimicrobiales bacterium]
MGFGHVVTSVTDLREAIDFYRDHLDFHLRNTWDIGVMEMAFLSPNQRHHSLAFAVRHAGQRPVAPLHGGGRHHRRRRLRPGPLPRQPACRW